MEEKVVFNSIAMADEVEMAGGTQFFAKCFEVVNPLFTVFDVVGTHEGIFVFHAHIAQPLGLFDAGLVVAVEAHGRGA